MILREKRTTAIVWDATAATRTRRRRRHLESRVCRAFAFLSFSSSRSPFSVPAKFKEPLLSWCERRKARVRPFTGTCLSDEWSATMISIRSIEFYIWERGSRSGLLRSSLTPFSPQLIRNYSGIGKEKKRERERERERTRERGRFE